MLGFAIMCANGAFRVQKDLFLDDQEPMNSGFLSFLSSVASSTPACVKPMPSIYLRPTSLPLIRPTSLSPIKPTPYFSFANQTHTDTILLTKAQLCVWCFFILSEIGDFVWSGLRKKIGDLGFFFFPAVDWWWWLWLRLWLWLMVEVVVVGAVDVFWVVGYIILL